MQQSVAAGVAEGAITVDLLYLDHEGGQRTVSRFSFIRREGHPLDYGEGSGSGSGSGSDEAPGDYDRSRQEWWVSLSMHHTLDAK